ncbi:hypothetical protein PJV90_09930 [Aliarcobacter butzleri]|jgi:hypothetical protein|uniref:hypothetical protein n=1 Tax=Aliarcobacter butzleri TaxID=28197 RepID=UPI00263CB6C9|nr:hypothetical protein [Aliarcobacter butzleri]MDN5128644.1 hypothetical protein [Aliarcobacter butzleri]
MKVSELINKLQSLPANADILCYTEDVAFQKEGHIFCLLDIEEVIVSDATKVRINHEPSLKLGKSENSEQHVLISVITDF